ncbi:MAG: molybdopterin-dependent oxidoreductase [Candidatus Poribacteria bacterium]
MAQIKLTVNGKEALGEKGDSVLSICEKNGIRIPTLCHHRSLVDTGACRVCLVEIKGTRGYRPACCTESNEGMVIKTDTDEIKRLRRSMLEFLFSERNHFCMFCEASGDCELQNLAYEHGIEHAKYDYAEPQVRVDSTRYYFVFDENRCILCQRCIRACSEVAGHNVLDLGKRGADARIISDLNVPFGESSCTSCGTCLQVCPTGALIDRKSSYMGRMAQCNVTKSTCSACSVGCGIEVVTRDNHILKVNGDFDTPASKGVLCVAGRFEPLHIDKERITKPMIKRADTYDEVGWDEALDYVSSKFKEIGMKNVIGLISPKATNEEASAFAKLFGNDKVGEFAFHTIIPSKDRTAVLDDVQPSDCILMYKINLDKESRVIGSFAKLAFYKGNATLILVDDKTNGFDKHATLKIKPEEINVAKELLERSSNPVIIYSADTTADELETLLFLSGKSKLLGLLAGANSRGLLNMGINGKVDTNSAKAFYVLAYDDGLKGKFNRYNSDFVVLQTSHATPEMEDADVILPAQIWSEKDGSITNIDGLVQKVVKTIDSPEGVQSNQVTIEILAQKVLGS